MWKEDARVKEQWCRARSHEISQDQIHSEGQYLQRQAIFDDHTMVLHHVVALYIWDKAEESVEDSVIC